MIGAEVVEIATLIGPKPSKHGRKDSIASIVSEGIVQGVTQINGIIRRRSRPGNANVKGCSRLINTVSVEASRSLGDVGKVATSDSTAQKRMNLDKD